MGKNYVESSLKRFLKKRVRITLGLVVTFLITGAVAFAEKTDNREQEHKDKIAGIENAVENLAGLGKGEISAGVNNQYVVVEKTADKTIIKKADDKSIIAEIDNSLISTKTAGTVSKVLSEMNGTNENGINKGVLASSQIISDKVNSNLNKLENNGIIITNANGQEASNIKDKELKIINNGIIKSGNNYGQTISNSSNLTAVNNGIIVGKYGQKIQNALDKNTLENNGIISVSDIGQKLATNGSLAINIGKISAGSSGQIISSGESSKIINYGEVYSKSYGQRAEGKDKSKNKAINYGIVESTESYTISASGKDNEAYNYGLVIARVKGMVGEKGGTVYNYGVVKATSTDSAFATYGGTVINKGIVIADNGTFNEQYNTGILLNSKYELREDDTATKEFHSGDTIQDFAGTNSFGKEISKGFVKNESVNIDNTENKVIGAVVTEKLENAVFNYAGNEKNGNDLFLKDTTITGYFETDGTLLDVGTGNLTLGGDTNITAVKNNFDLDVTAVQLGENGKITIMDDAKINGLIKGNENSEITFTQSKGKYNVDGGGKVAINIGEADPDGSRYQQYFDVTLGGATDGVTDNKVSEIEISTGNGVKDLTNKLVIESGLTVGKNADGLSIYDTNTTNENAELEIIVDSIHNLEGNVQLGVGKDTFIIKSQDPHGAEDEGHKDKVIDLGAGEDKFIAEGTDGENIFGYNVKNAETIELKNGTWGNWDKAGKISFGDKAKADNKSTLLLGKDTTMNITLNTEKEGSDFANYVGDNLDLDHAVITGNGETSKVKYLIGYDGLDSSKLYSDKYSFDEGTVKFQSAIFDIKSEENKGTTVTVKTAEDMGLSGQDRIIYNAYLNEIRADGNIDKDAEKIIDQINGYNSSEEFADHIKGTSVTGEAYYTAGSVVTMDIADTYMSAVEDFTKRAGKGEWLAQGKYINSDTEFDGGSSVKGYEGDVTGTVGMIEYGFTENTSYGAVFGMGDSEMDIDGGGKLDGDNTYAGLYMKHRTSNGIELVANIGYVENDMDSVLRNDFDFNQNGVAGSGNSFEKGTADSSAVVIGVKGRKDYKVTDTVKLQPVLGARATLINQDEAENPEMHFTIKEQDIIVLEGTAGMGIAKEIALSQGKLELNAGAEYTFAASSSTNDAEYTLFNTTEIKLEDVDAAENTGTLYVGADYEHENGVGFNGKYEMLWSDKGDDSRITAGISYRF